MKKIIVFFTFCFFININAFNFTGGFSYNDNSNFEFMGFDERIDPNNQVLPLEYHILYDFNMNIKQKVYKNFYLGSDFALKYFAIKDIHTQEYKTLYYNNKYINLTPFIELKINNRIAIGVQYLFRYFIESKYFDNGSKGNIYTNEVLYFKFDFSRFGFYIGLGPVSLNTIDIYYKFKKLKYWDKLKLGIKITGLYYGYSTIEPIGIEIPYGRTKFYLDYKISKFHIEIFYICKPDILIFYMSEYGRGKINDVGCSIGVIL